jgi:hypothetical protein
VPVPVVVVVVVGGAVLVVVVVVVATFVQNLYTSSPQYVPGSVGALGQKQPPTQ